MVPIRSQTSDILFLRTDLRRQSTQHGDAAKSKKDASLTESTGAARQPSSCLHRGHVNGI